MNKQKKATKKSKISGRKMFAIPLTDSDYQHKNGLHSHQKIGRLLIGREYFHLLFFLIKLDFNKLSVCRQPIGKQRSKSVGLIS